jgi:nucleoside 2-deoxyribosyltransferase
VYYIAHRLFAAHDRALAADLAERLADKVGPNRVFLPFCDTDEEELVANVKGRRLFELDRERLRRIDAMVAILHGPSLDDGVCMEIGYAWACGVPVVVLTTDFQTYSLTEDGPRLEFPDPLIEAAATRVIRLPRLGPPTTIPESGAASRFTAFRERNLVQVASALDAAVEALLELPTTARCEPRLLGSGTVFIEPSPYSRQGVDYLVQAFVSAGHHIVVPQRFAAPDPVAAAVADLTAAVGATRLLVDVSGPETPPGGALLIGAACAIGTPTAAYVRRTSFTHAVGREPNWRNLMIQYAVQTRLDTPEAVRAWLSA